MKNIIYLILVLLLIVGCSKEPKVVFEALPNTNLSKSNFSELSEWGDEKYDEALDSFINNCRSKKAQKIYADLCKDAELAKDSKSFFESEFTPYSISTKSDTKEGLLTGYYEPTLRASLEMSEEYKYPIYETPNDLIVVDLSAIYPELKNYRLRGRIKGNRLVPYDTREESKNRVVDANAICYTDSQVDKFFLEIQGSGRVILDDNSTLFIGYDNQNGHKYRAIGRYLVKIGALRLKDVSLQSIRAWLDDNPSRVEEVLNYNKSMVYFGKRSQGATGALGLELTPSRSVAVDRRYIPLGSMLYLDAQMEDGDISGVVFAQDTGGAIKGAVRADLFLGSGKKALDVAGRLKAPLKLWILIPNE